MEISNNLNATNSVQGVTPAQQSPSRVSQTHSNLGSAMAEDSATVSNAASGAAQITSADDVRFDKVAGIQQALADGTYNVPASAVASKMVDSMLSRGK